MDREMKSRGGAEEGRREEQKREGQEREDQRRERVGRKKIQVREKGRKVAKHCVFSRICGSRGSKSRLAKVAGAETAGQIRDEKLHAVVTRSTFPSQSKSKCTKHLSSGAILEVAPSKKCTPLWRKAQVEVKMYKTHQVRTTFGSNDVEKVHAVVARSAFRSQNVKNTTCSRHFWKFRCRKSAHRCGAKHISKSKCEKHHMLGPLLDVQMPFRVAGARDYRPCQKRAKREGFVECQKMMAGVGHLKRIWKDAFSMAGTVQETCSSELLGGPGADFLRGVAFWSLRS